MTTLLRLQHSLLKKNNPLKFQVSITNHTIYNRQPNYYILTNGLTRKTVRYHGSHHHHGSHGDHVHTDIVSTIKTSGKNGMRITIVGLLANVGLTISKGVGGWYMNSASLLADATHSLSDLLSDFVTLYTFKMSRKQPDDIYPYGYGKFETIGSFAVSTLLVSGGVAIGFHSFDLLTTVLETLTPSSSTITDTISSLTSSSIETTASTTASTTTAANTANEAVVSNDHSHSTGSIASFFEHHHHSNVLDPNAAWFALASVLVKEWLYHATIKVGKSEHSDVLIANAWHHRSDAFSSIIALVAIVGSHFGLPVLDPLGGLLVSGLIVKSGLSIMTSSVQELMDKGLSKDDIEDIKSVIEKVKKNEPHLLDFYYIRGRKVGPFKHLDMILHLDPKITIDQAHGIEQHVRSTIKKEVPMVQEILIHLDAEKQPPHH